MTPLDRIIGHANSFISEELLSVPPAPLEFFWGLRGAVEWAMPCIGALRYLQMQDEVFVACYDYYVLCLLACLLGRKELGSECHG